MNNKSFGDNVCDAVLNKYICNKCKRELWIESDNMFLLCNCGGELKQHNNRYSSAIIIKDSFKAV